MATLGLELSDVGVHGVLIEDDGSSRTVKLGDRTERLPAYAFSGSAGDGLVFGSEAQELGQVYPRRVNSSFIDDLSLQATSFGGNQTRTAYSQIAYHFFSKLVERIREDDSNIERVIIAVPGHYMEDNELAAQRIGILLGILKDLQIPVAGVVDMAAASLYSEGLWNVAEGERLFHIDLLLHATHITVFNKHYGLERVYFSRQPQHGFSKMQEKFVHALANRFLKHTSFDITEDRRIEQAFHSQTRDMLFHLGKSGEASLEVSTREKSRQMTITRDLAAMDLAPYVKVLAQMLLRAINDFGAGEGPVQILLSERAAAVHGLKEAIAAQGVGAVKQLPAESAAFGAANLGKSWTVPESIEDVRVETGIVLEAPSGKDGEAGASIVPIGAIRLVRQGKSLNPTHIVCDGLAYELGEEEFIIGFGESESFDLVVESNLTPSPAELCRLKPEEDRWVLAESKSTIVEAVSISTLKAGDSLEVALPGRRKQLLLIHCLQ
ncbi:hypothetical protein [Pelagicoccus sp. SDUM812003]|uniref:hypothetical protein n=1 Tax=Pelagicoccus sp. SDUM812003 TaxID=3041267 RepID=UPI00280CD68F|nr:hypothetical protein [Pelagicoccus sp. SDUM812003]MDQ8203266.1 hypothetical protein [Pelagicoccus sp. SDUM812003]